MGGMGMILLDTHVISEPQPQAPSARLWEWIDVRALGTLDLSAIPVPEMRPGMELKRFRQATGRVPF